MTTTTPKKTRGGQKSENFELNDSYPSKQARRLERQNKSDEPHKPNPLVEARLEKLKKETEKLELDIQIQKGLYIPASEVTSTVATEYTRVRQKLLALESKLSYVLAPITDPVEVRKIIDQEVQEILEELSYSSELLND